MSERGQSETEAWHHELAEAIPQLVWVWGEDGPEFYNRRFIEYTGRTLEVGRRVSWLESVHPDDRPRAEERFAHAERTGTTYESEIRVRAQDGTYRWFLSRAWPTLGPTGQPIRWFGTMTDIDSTKRERQRMAHIQAFTASLSAARTLDDVARTIVAHGCQAFGSSRGVFALVVENGAFVRVIHLSGWPQPVMDAWADRRIPISADTPLTKSVRTGAPVYIEDKQVAEMLRRLDPDAMRADSIAMLALPVVEGSRPVGALGLAYTAARAFSEDDLREFDAFARLCGQAIDRATLFDLAQAERRRAEDANKAKDLFLATVSHELRTPLTAILGWATMLRSRTTPPAVLPKALEVIERNARLQAQLIDDLLDVARILSGSLRLSPTDIDPVAVIEAAIDVVRPLADSKGIKLETALDAALVPMRADAARLQQIACNLLSNAVKFTPGGGRVLISLIENEGFVELLVEDTGKGIPASFLPHVFEPFRQADVGTTRAHGGLGLGLAITHHLVELHRGTITAESDGEGRGARFLVRLPLSNDSEASHEVSLEEPAPRAEAPRLDGRRVLVIDDEPDVIELVKTVLVSAGAIVSTATTATEGLELVRQAHPDVILSDIGMPVEDGYAFIEQLRALPPSEGGRTRAMALSAYTRAEDRRRSLQLGFDSFVSKPIEAAELVRLVGRLCS